MIGARPVHARRRRFLLASLLMGGLLMLGRGVQVQVLEASSWKARAADQQRERLDLPAPRGAIYDRHGVPLAASREAFQVAVAPREVNARAELASRLRSDLGLDASVVRRALDRRRRWVVLPGRWDAVARSHLDGLRGVYFERVVERFYPHGAIARELLGGVNREGKPLGGLELELDSLLHGEPGAAVVRRDARGRPIPGAMLVVKQPRAGDDVYLTIDLALQEIAADALRKAVADAKGVGGDLVMANPRTGEILAAVSVRDSTARHWRAVTDPYEPGSTLKPFMAAALLASHEATMSDTVYAEEGHYDDHGRVITDDHPYGWLTLREVLRYSSNIGMAKLASRLLPDQQYDFLRDFGFGTPTGVEYPTESGGLLRRPSQWSGYSQASLAIGYEISVTALQMTMAYGALANGGVLMEPQLIRSVRGRGRVLERMEPRAVRRVVPASVTEAVREALMDVVQEGTGRQADLGAFHVAGKTGTARTFVGGHYESGRYTASFAGFFPAEDPQLVFLAKIDQGDRYGGGAAAPATGAALAAALAMRNSPLDREAVVRSAPDPVPQLAAAGVALPRPADERASRLADPVVFNLEPNEDEPVAPRSSVVTRPARVPDVRGEAVRDAARRLHEAGFRVEVRGSGEIQMMSIPPGATRPRGTVIVLFAEGRDG
ncbi:MAG: penicillin-binding transpeptidase domain-containing protein [Gemmatimonadota bacterium]